MISTPARSCEECRSQVATRDASWSGFSHQVGCFRIEAFRKNATPACPCCDAVHVLAPGEALKTWMPATRTGMTRVGSHIRCWRAKQTLMLALIGPVAAVATNHCARPQMLACQLATSGGRSKDKRNYVVISMI